MVVYGIPNCDTTQKAVKWLQKNKLAFSFHDYKLQGITKEKLQQWCDAKGVDTIFNKRSTTWRELTAAEQEKAATVNGAIRLMQQHNSIIKRPIIESNGTIIVGYNEKELEKQLQ
ncbi:MAG: Spx/MgsR family RNA polymerase-binding regulatory protein [Bacteroidetes bacterium]|nr:Spx/MgsR family RNA polymerase-binding regulatory protein [Bacteroidota bacterium]